MHFWKGPISTLQSGLRVPGGDVKRAGYGGLAQMVLGGFPENMAQEPGYEG